MEQITEHDCVHACFSESKFRSDRFKAMMEIDQQDDFCKTTFKMLKAKKTETLSEVPICWEIGASLLRSKPGSTALKMDSFREIPKFASLRFSDAEIGFSHQDGCKVYFKTLDGNVPPRGILKVMYTAVTADEIGLEFKKKLVQDVAS